MGKQNRIIISFCQVMYLSTSALAMEGVIVPVSPFQKPYMIHENENDLVTSCAQFSGSWQGYCESNEGKKELKMTIDQKECSSISVDGTVYRIDGMESTASSQGVSMINGSTVLSWDSDKIKINGNTQKIGQILGKRKSIKYQYQNKFTLEREKLGLMLTTDSQADTFMNDFKKSDKGESICRLEKKIDLSKKEEVKIK